MKVQLECNECGYEEWGTSHGTLMNKIKMWNHLKKEHPMLAERMMKNHDMLPNHFYSASVGGTLHRETRPITDIRPAAI